MAERRAAAPHAAVRGGDAGGLAAGDASRVAGTSVATVTTSLAYLALAQCGGHDVYGVGLTMVSFAWFVAPSERRRQFVASKPLVRAYKLGEGEADESSQAEQDGRSPAPSSCPASVHAVSTPHARKTPTRARTTFCASGGART